MLRLTVPDAGAVLLTVALLRGQHRVELQSALEEGQQVHQETLVVGTVGIVQPDEGIVLDRWVT